MEKVIGKKVYKVDEVTISELRTIRVMRTDKVFTIKGYKDYDESNDYCPHYILDNGEEIRSFNAVFVPDYSLPEADMINKFLSDNELFAEDVYTNGEGYTAVSISWGDWKHEHGWCDVLMEYISYEKVTESVTEENGSDCYSSIHYYHKAK